MSLEQTLSRHWFTFQRELFFKWIQRYRRIKAFFGTSQNAVKTRSWIAISVYLLEAILKKELKTTAASEKSCKSSASPSLKKFLRIKYLRESICNKKLRFL